MTKQRDAAGTRSLAGLPFFGSMCPPSPREGCAAPNTSGFHGRALALDRGDHLGGAALVGRQSRAHILALSVSQGEEVGGAAHRARHRPAQAAAHDSARVGIHGSYHVAIGLGVGFAVGELHLGRDALALAVGGGAALDGGANGAADRPFVAVGFIRRQKMDQIGPAILDSQGMILLVFSRLTRLIVSRSDCRLQ